MVDEEPVYETLVNADTLRENTSRWRVLDCRASLTDDRWGLGRYREGHIPGAVYADLATDLSAPPGTGGRHPLPDREVLAERFRAWGLSQDQQLVCYDDAGGVFAARAWWLARWLGHGAVAVLDGGLTAWSAPLETEVPDPPRGTFQSSDPLTRTVEAQDVLAGLDGPMRLIDARTQARFDGLEEPIDPKAGHIPGAQCVPFQGNLADTGHFLTTDALRQRWAPFAADAQALVCYCGSGVSAAHNILALKHSGFDEPALYPGSWSEWLRDPERPTAP